MNYNRRTDFEDDDDDISFGTDDEQENAAELLQQTRQQQQQVIDQLRLNVQSNAAIMASLMINSSSGMSIPLSFNPQSFSSSPGMVMNDERNYSGPTIPPRQPSTNPELQMALVEAQRQGIAMENATTLHQSHIQQQIQPNVFQQANSVMLQDQMFRLNNHESPYPLMDPRILGNALYQPESVAFSQSADFMPPEARTLYSSQIASNLMSMRNPLDFNLAYVQGQMPSNGPEEDILIPGSKTAIEPFPEKLHRLLTETEKNGQEDTIAFTEDGKSFEILKPVQFFKEIVPKYFKQTKLSSFKRQLNLYGFDLTSSGLTRGLYTHPSFQRDRPDLARTIRRRDLKLFSRPNVSKLKSNSSDSNSMLQIAALADQKEAAPADTDTNNER